MVSLGLHQTIEESSQPLEDKIKQQVAEIMEAADVEEEQGRDLKPQTPNWKFSMPFAGVRYFSYD